eukprot:546341-Prymnesium_polylepis.2
MGQLCKVGWGNCARSDGACERSGLLGLWHVGGCARVLPCDRTGALPAGGKVESSRVGWGNCARSDGATMA